LACEKQSELCAAISFRQFLVESLITTVIAFLLAVIIVGLLLPPFNDFVNKKFSLFASVGLRFWAIAVG
jgi:putative ABC transport system permease protein